MAKRKPICKGQVARGDMPLDEFETDPLDFGFLTAARHFFVSFSDHGSGAWVMTFLAAESYFPGPDAAETMRRALSVVHEMRTSRRSPFRYSNPYCPCCAAIVTKDERYLLQMIQEARAGRMSRAISSAMLLCEGNAIDRLMTATFAFADMVSVLKPVTQAR